MNQTNLQGETERALRAANKNCEHCGHPLGFSVMGEYCTNRACSYIDGHYSGPREVVAPEKTYSQAEFNAGIAGAYAAAAKHAPVFTRSSETPNLLVSSCACGWQMDFKSSPHRPSAEQWEAHILALTPADARQTSQLMQPVTCAKLAHDIITWVSTDTPMDKLAERHLTSWLAAAIASAETKGWQDCLRNTRASVEGYPNEGGDIEVMTAIQKLITSAEASARLELIERIVHYKKEFHEVGSRESNAIQFILNQLCAEAAARTPDSTKEPE